MAAVPDCTTCDTSDAPPRACTRCKTVFYCSEDCQAANWPTHKADCTRPNYLLRFQIYPKEFTDPPIWRTLSVLATSSFTTLHRALQIAFGWATTHNYEFHIHDPAYDPKQDPRNDLLYRLRRQSQVPFEETDVTHATDAREYLVRVVNDAEKTTVPSRGGRPPIDTMHKYDWEHPNTPVKKASQTKMFKILDKKDYKGLKLTYLYDYGDCWEHDFEIQGTAPATLKIKCLDGEGHGVAEDAGVKGWKRVLEAYRTSSPSQEQKEKRVWFERQAAHADPADLHNGGDRRWSKEDINRKLGVLS